MLQITRDITQPLGFETFIAPAEWTSPDQYAQFGNEVNIYAIFCAYQHPNKAYAYTFSNSVNTLTLVTSSNVSYCYGFSFGGVDYRFEIVGGVINWNLLGASTKRWVIVNNINENINAYFQNGAIYGYCSKKVSTTKSDSSIYIKTVFYENNNSTALIAQAFANCPNLHPYITFSPFLKVIGNSSFSGCISLAGVVAFPVLLESIGITAFQSCDKITRFVFQSNVKTIGAYAFSYCESLTEFELPPNLISTIGLGTGIIRNTHIQLDKLTSQCDIYPIYNGIIIEKSGANYIRIFSATTTCLGSLDFTLPIVAKSNGIDYNLDSNLISIGDYAFMLCDQIASISLPNTLTYIGYSAFYSCTGITTINMPNFIANVTIDSPFIICPNVTILNIAFGYKESYNTWNFSQKLSLTTATADTLAQSMINISAGTALVTKIIHIGAINKTNLLANGTPTLITTMNSDLTTNYKQLNASNTTVAVIPVLDVNGKTTQIVTNSIVGYLTSGTILVGSINFAYTTIIGNTFTNVTPQTMTAYAIGTIVSEV